MLNIDELTVKEIKLLQALLNGSTQTAAHPYQVGQNYFIRTVTHYYTGHLTLVTDGELVLANAAWIADTGRFHDALKTGELSEIEPFEDDVIIGRGAVVDACIWKHTLPRTQK